MCDLFSPLIQLEPRGRNHHISQGRTVLTTARDGSVDADGEQGLWVYETRVLSRYLWQIAGKSPTFSALSAVDQHHDLSYFIFPPPECEKSHVPGCDPAQNSIEIRIERRVGEGLLEEVTLTNHTQLTTSFSLELKIAADFADPSEATGKRKQKGRLTEQWQRLDTGGFSLSFDYKAEHAYRHQGDAGTASFHRGVRLRLQNDRQEPEYHSGRIHFPVKLAPRELWHATLTWTAQMDGSDLPSPANSTSSKDDKRRAFFDSSARYDAPEIASLAPIVLKTLHQSAIDLAALRLYDLDGSDALGERWMPAAGIPMYIGLFARDVLFSSREAASINAAMMRGSLTVLAEHLGTRVDNWRDEQPGRIVHAMHSSPTAMMNYNPHSRYYGGVTGSIFYPSVVADLWRWTGNKELVAPFLEPALRALAWADKYSRDDSGFYKYRTRSKQGEKNQGWKDSGDAIVYPDGSQVPDPLGTCEMQGYVYASKLRLSEVLWSMDDKDNARRLQSEADELKKHFNEFFWMREEGYIAFGIDSHNQPVRSIASDPGHCLMHGIVDDAHKETVARRMLADDMFSGWGIRTLSSQHPAFNPFSYHCGSVWPVENGEFVSALARCGMHDEMNRLAKAMFESAALFKYCRLPEVFAGHARDEAHPFPGLYPKANSPQAWSASAPILVLQSILGIQPYAPMRTLLLDPHLPEWLPEIVLHRLHVGDATVSIRFWRDTSGNTAFEIVASDGELRVVRHPDPWSLVEGSGEQVQANISSLADGPYLSASQTS